MKKTNAPRGSQRAEIHYTKGKMKFVKMVPASRAIIIADEYRRKTGNPVKIKIS